MAIYGPPYGSFNLGATAAPPPAPTMSPSDVFTRPAPAGGPSGIASPAGGLTPAQQAQIQAQAQANLAQMAQAGVAQRAAAGPAPVGGPPGTVIAGGPVPGPGVGDMTNQA